MLNAEIKQIKQIKPMVRNLLIILLIIAYVVYFVASMMLNSPFAFLIGSSNLTENYLDEHVFANNKGLGLFCLTFIVTSLISWEKVINPFLKKRVQTKSSLSSPPPSLFEDVTILQNNFVKRWLLKLVLVALCLIYIFYNMESVYNLISLCGFAVFILVCVLISKHPSRINWHLTLTGVLIQFIVAVLILRVEFGFKLFKLVASLVTSFINFTNVGSELVFGKSYTDHFFAFQVRLKLKFTSFMSKRFFLLLTTF